MCIKKGETHGTKERGETMPNTAYSQYSNANVGAALGGRMAFLSARQAVVAGNIANANTPGYLARDLQQTAPSGSFAMAVTNAGHMAPAGVDAGGGKIVEDARFIQHNGNSVRLDQEMLKMNDTQLDYRMMTELYAKQVALQKVALGRQ